MCNAIHLVFRLLMLTENQIIYVLFFLMAVNNVEAFQKLPNKK